MTSNGLKASCLIQATIDLVFALQVKGMRLKKGPSDKKFSIQGVLNDRVLGQHAGELLVDHIESMFGVEAVLGILCMQTTVCLS